MARRLSRRVLTGDEVRELLCRLREEYEPEEGIWSEEDERSVRVKRKMKELEVWQRDMMLLYIEWRNMAKVARTLKISRQTAYKYIDEIKARLK